MKKLFYLLFIVSIGNFSCGPICACEPVTANLYLVIRSDAGDLLNPKTVGYFPKEEIKLTLKRKNEQETQIGVRVNPPIDYGKIKLSYYQLVIENPSVLTYKDFELYLTLPNKAPALVKIAARKDWRKLEGLSIGGINIKPEDKFPLNTLFYYTL